MEEHLCWIVSRAGGIAAHEALSLATLLALVVHAVTLLGVSYFFRARIGVARWKRLHRWTALAWLAGIAHSLGQGTDAGTAWFLVCTAVSVVPALVLLVVRHLPSNPVPSRT